jgi:hypothetical protein
VQPCTTHLGLVIIMHDLVKIHISPRNLPLSSIHDSIIYLPSLSSSFSLSAFATSAGVTPAASAAFSCSFDSGDLTSSNSC